MVTSSRPGPLLRATVLLGGLGAFLACQPIIAGPLTEYTGYTRPSNVSLAKSKAIKKAAIGEAGFARKSAKEIAGTIYYMVLDRTKGKAGDPWGTGIPDFEKRFKVSRDVKGHKLDTEARYLYLYQVVNDSGEDGWVY